MARDIIAGGSFKIGLFSANCSSGLAVTTVPERWSGSWDDNLATARIADASGVDFLLPIARWIGYGGQTNFHEGVLDPVAWASGLLAATERITVFATVHTAFNSPVVTAKQIATMDQIGHGRAGLNVVAGWNKPEYEAFGADLPQSHDTRYELAQEWLDLVQRLWYEDGRFDHDGARFRLRGVESAPGPAAPGLPILNAGASPQGREFAARNADFLFAPVQDAAAAAQLVADVRARAAAHSREMGVLTLSHVVCRPTRAEAEEFYRYYSVEHADEAALDNLMTLQGLHAQSFTPEMLAGFRSRFAAGHGSYPLVGTPDCVAGELARLHAAGLCGTTVAFVDYTRELPYFVEEVLPRLVRLGVRAS